MSSNLKKYFFFLMAVLLLPGAMAFADASPMGNRGGGGFNRNHSGQRDHGDRNNDWSNGEYRRRRNERPSNFYWSCAYAGMTSQNKTRMVRGGTFVSIYFAQSNGLDVCRRSGLKDCRLVACNPY